MNNNIDKSYTKDSRHICSARKDSCFDINVKIMQNFTSNMNLLGRITISIFTIIIIQLVFLTQVIHFAFAPPFGAHPTFRPPEFGHEFTKPEITITKPEITITKPEITITKPEIVPEKIVSSIKDISVEKTDSKDAKTNKIDEILRLLDTNTQVLDRQFRESILRDAYTFANTVLVPIMNEVVARFLASYFISLLN